MRAIERFGTWIACAIIIVASALVWQGFPQAADYRIGADEGAYHRQGSSLIEYGPLAGFRRLATEYVADPAQQAFPNPLRVGTIVVAAAALRVDDSYATLSFVSLLAFAAMLAGIWRYSRSVVGTLRGLLVIALVAFCPLTMGLARRALMDSLACMTAAFAIFAFLHALQARNARASLRFIALFAIAILVKETNVLLAPFFALLLAWASFRKEGRLPLSHAFGLLVLPPVLALAAQLVIFGPELLVQVAKVVAAQSASRNEYMLAFAQGPWYRYLIDFLMLSPWTFLLAAGGAVLLLVHRNDRQLVYWLVLTAYLLAVYSVLDKDARFLVLLSLPLALLASVSIEAILDASLSQVRVNAAARTGEGLVLAAFLVLVAAILVQDVRTFRRYFIDGGIYDPMTYQMLLVDRIVPGGAPSAPAVGSSLEANQRRWLEHPTADNAHALSYEYCSAKKWLECRRTSEEALKQVPPDATLLTNLCMADAGLKEWPAAVAACREAARLDPDSQLARNNLDWVSAEAAKGSR